MPTVHLMIKGKVQGVFFRATAREKANDLGLTGWIRNTPEGWVELMATGDDVLLQSFIDWCHQGPPKAVVTQVQVKEVPETAFEGFRIMKSE